MAKLTKWEAERREIVDYIDNLYLDTNYRLDELVSRYGGDATINAEYESGYYGDDGYCSLKVIRIRVETDEEYKARTDEILAMKADLERKRKDAKKKKEESDRREYERLKKKFEGK